jgi:hypothetical protein
VPYRAPARERLRYVRYCLDVLTTPTKCRIPWEIMDGSECQRTCPLCQKQVFDVAAMDGLYADDFLKEHMVKPPRLRLHRRPDGRVLPEECGRGARQRVAGRIVTALVVVAALAAFAALR